MRRIATVVMLAVVSVALAGSSGAPVYSAAALDALDPTRIATALCGSARPGAALMRELLIASAYATPAGHAGPIPLYPDLTKSPFPLSSQDPQVRRYFSQGLLLSYGFNHAGAVRSFREAQRRDPTCAMCWWGEAAALGPNINAPMDARDRGAALAALERAMALRGEASELERALIEALSQRYSADPAADRAALDAAYADAMLDVAGRFPADDDVAVLAAEAAMDTSPWNYWEADRTTPIGRIGPAIQLIETVMSRNPTHVQAAHLYIHLLEASDPARAEAAADRLAQDLAPSAAHLVHMPGHIYYARGRFADSIRVNVAAARADETYIHATDDRGLVRYGYYPHNIHFIVTSAQMAGDMATAIREAKRLRLTLDTQTSAKIGWVQAIDAAPFLAMAQFAEPAAILKMAAPDARLPYAVGMRHFARAVAFARLGDALGFDAELGAIAAIKASGALADLTAQGMPAPDLLSIAEAVARGRLAMARRDYDAAAGAFRAAAEIEARIPYQEPPFWYYPVHQSLGAALLLGGRPDEASAAFRTALLRYPANGWALFGLARSEAARGRNLEAAAARKAFARAWAGKRPPRIDRL